MQLFIVRGAYVKVPAAAFVDRRSLGFEKKPDSQVKTCQLVTYLSCATAFGQ